MSVNNHLLWIAREFGDPAYGPLSVADLEALEAVTTVDSFGSGARLYREGEVADACFLIRSGEVRLVREGGAPTINLSRIRQGQVIGDYAMFRHTPHAATAKAMSTVTAVRMERERIMDTLATRPRIGLRWLMEALARVEMANERMSVILRGSVVGRVAAYLLSETDDGRVDITHDALAEMVAAERASVSRAIARLRDQGAITNNRGSIDIVDRERLATIRDS